MDLPYVCFKLGELQWKRMKCSVQFSVIVPCGEDRLFSGFLDSGVWRLRLKIVIVPAIPLQGAQS